MLKGEKLVAWWYSPRNGKAHKIGKFTNDGSKRSFTPPTDGEALDWVLVVDVATRKYPAPGKVSSCQQ
jgi:hypothetical protein